MRNWRNWFWGCVLLAGLVVSGLPARADTIAGGSVGLANPATVITFDEFGNLGNGTVVTNQWAAFGVTFGNMVWTAGPGPVGFSGGWLATGSPGAVTISFSAPVTGAAFMVQDFTNVFLFEAFLGGSGGTLVESFMPGPVSGGSFIGFQNSYFDTIQIRLISQESATFAIATDNLQIQPVPEPATLILLGTGLAGIGGLVRRKRSA